MRRQIFLEIILKTSPGNSQLTHREISEEVQNCVCISDGDLHPGKFDINLIPENRLDEVVSEFRRIYPAWIDSHREEAA